MADQQQYSIRREARLLRDALAPYEIPLILLKGAAYVAAGLPAARGACLPTSTSWCPTNAWTRPNRR
jgi:hypothetical protein